MIWRILFALVSLTALGALLYLRQADSNGADLLPGEPLNTEPGYVAIHGDLVETGDNGHPMYRLDADRIEQPTPQGLIYLTNPRLDFQPEPNNHWTITAFQGELPQEAQSADLSGNVHAEGRPGGSDQLMRIDSDLLHLDMPDQIAATPSKVTAQWKGMTLTARGMRYDMKRNALELKSDVHGALGNR
jgi:LPS export ABC transporter protein LptC